MMGKPRGVTHSTVWPALEMSLALSVSQSCNRKETSRGEVRAHNGLKSIISLNQSRESIPAYLLCLCVKLNRAITFKLGQLADEVSLLFLVKNYIYRAINTKKLCCSWNKKIIF